jgi:predicted permease
VPGALGLTNTRENLSRSVRILGATVAVLLLIVCINLINLLLARAESRRAEMAVRLAIGAGRWRLVRQLVTEVCLLTLCGGVAGLVVARWAKDLALVWVGRMIPGFELTIPLDERVVGIAAALALVVSVVIGIIPALRATRVDANPALQNASPGTTGRRQIVGPALLVAQVALAVVMVVTAGLLVKTLRNLETADLGFNSENVLLFKANRAEASSAAPRTIDNPASALDRMVDRINGLPGVHAVAFSQYSLLQGEVAMPFLHIPGLAKAPDEDRTVYTQAVSPTFFSTMEMPLTAGRSFAAGDRNVPVAIVNETLARRFFPETGALGRHIGITKDPEAGAVKDAELLEIVGIVRDAKYMTIREPTLPTVFLARIDDGPVVFAVRTSVAPMSLVAAVTQATREARPAMVSSEFRTEAEQAARTFAEERHFAWVASVFGVLALLLTSIGLYGLLSYSVARRTREIGIRVALGANRGRVMRSVLGETLGVITLGAVIGLIAASVTTRVVQSLLFGLAPSDLIAQAAAVSAIFIVAFLAAVVPARRAARVDPVIALRTD